MTASFKLKKFLLVWITIIIGVTCAGAQAADTNPGITVPGYGVYDFSIVHGTFTDNSTLLQLQPWWHSSSKALTFANAGGYFGNAPDFAYSTDGVTYNSWYHLNQADDGIRVNESKYWGFAVATCVSGCAAVPEIGGALIPQVGFLLAGLFLMFGRRKENTETMLAA
jgi:hypothetical protein